MTDRSDIASLPLITRAVILAHARTWIGTPYHHQASCLGGGTDCVGLVRGVYRTLYGREAQSIPGYSRDWAEASGEETLVDAARCHLVEIDPSSAGPADVLVFRYRPRMVAKHTGILAATGTGQLTLVHALEGAPVSEVPFSDWWRRRIAAAFSFPGITD